MSDEMRLAVQIEGKMRTESVMGREYRILPAVLVQEQVLNNNIGAMYLPADEIAKSADAWNMVPVVVRHPEVRGMPVSARSPRVIDELGAGFLFNARAEGAKLKADVYIDTERLMGLAELGPFVGNAEAGNPGEVSTGFRFAGERRNGMFEGKAYNVVARDIVPDHLALLPDQTGACSVSDGCGLGVNAEGDSMTEDLFSRFAATVERLVANFGGSPATNTEEDNPMERDEMIAHLADVGPLGAERLATLTDCELRAMAVHFAPEPTEEEARPEAEPEAVEDLRPVADNAELEALRAENARLAAELDAPRKELVAELAANERVAFNAEELGEMTFAQLRKLSDSVRAADYSGRGAPRSTATNAALTEMPVKPYWQTNTNGRS